MNEALTAGLTVFAGFAVFVAGQTVQRFVLEPIQEQRKIMGEIAFALLYHDNVGALHKQEYRNEVGTNLRKLAGELRATRSTIPVYGLLERTPWVPDTHNLIKASSGLVGWSNATFGGHEDSANYHKDNIAQNLNIRRS